VSREIAVRPAAALGPLDRRIGCAFIQLLLDEVAFVEANSRSSQDQKILEFDAILGEFVVSGLPRTRAIKALRAGAKPVVTCGE
jgi:hypothetical protein